ncbi:MAG: glycosyltransferase [Bacteroidetes bacterium]|nr:glycosyltransferase [Bacteroidota bacterium]
MPGSGVNSNYFRPLSNPRNDNKFVFLFIGRLLYDKGVEEYAEASKQVRQIAKNAECWIVGELSPSNPSAVSKSKFFNWIESKNIRYFGTTKDIRGYIKQADVVVLPSYREGVPRAILEAMSMEKPIITTDVAGCNDTVEEGENGFIVPPKDSVALARAMIQMYLQSAEELEIMGKKSRQYVLERFDDKIITKSYLKLLREVLHTFPDVKSKRKGQAIL